MKIVHTKNGRPLTPQEMDGLRKIGSQLRRARLGNGWSQHRLERLSGVDQTTISRLENGQLLSLRLARIADLMQALSGKWSIFEAHAAAAALRNPDDPDLE
jgi:transcriptional regulator with XRE-family HTH domain